MRLFVAPVVLLIACLFPLAAPRTAGAQSGSVQLRWKLPEGRVFKVENTQQMVLVQFARGQHVRRENSSTTWMTWKVGAARDDGLANVTTTIDRVLVQIDEGPAGKSGYDSSEPVSDRNPLAGALDRVYRPMLNFGTAMVMSPTGAVTEVRIPDEALRGIEQSAASTVMDRSMLERMVRESSPSFPESLEPGQSWQRKSEVPLSGLGNMQLESEYNYRGTESVDGRNLHRVDVAIAIRLELAPNLRNVGIEIIEQDNGGEILFDQEAGRINRSTMKQDLTMEIRSEGQVITQNLVQRVTTTFSDRE